MDVRDFVRRRLRPALLPLDVGVEHQQDRAAAGGDRVVLTGAEAVLQDPSDSPFLRSLLVPMGNDGDGGEVLTLRVRWLRAPTLMVLGRVLTDELRLNVSFAGGAPRAAIDGAGVMEARLYPPGCVLSWRGTGAGHMRRRVPDDVPHKDAVVQRADVAGLNGVDLPFLWRVGVLPPMRPAQRDHLTRNVERSGWPWINESNLKAGGIPQPERVMQAGRVLWALERARASEAADSLAWAACGSWEEALALAQDRMAEYASFSNVQVRVTWAASPGLEWRGATVRPEGCHVELSCVEDGRHTGAHHFRGVPDEEACRRRATEMLEFCANEDEPAQVVFVEGRGPPQVSTVWPSEAAATQLFEDSADYDVLQRATMVRKADSGEVCGGGGASQDCAKSDMLLKVHRDTVHGCQRLCKVHPRCAGIAVPTKASSEMLRRSSQALGALDKLSYIKEELDALREDLHEPDDGSMDRPVAKNSDEEAAKMRERFNNLQAEYDAGTRALDRISKSAEFDCFLLNRDFNEDTVETRFPPSDWAYFLKRSKFYKKQ